MNFDTFLRISPRPASGPVKFVDIKSLIIQHHPTIADVKVWSVAFSNPNKGRGHFIKKRDRTSVYEDPFDIAEVRYCKQLNTNELKPIRRYIIIKELMHVFDRVAETVDCPDDLKRLLADIQNRPLSDDASAQYESDVNAHWKALIVLCPPEVRTRLLTQIATGKMEEEEAAQELEIPLGLTKAVLGPYYVKALEVLTEQNA